MPKKKISIQEALSTLKSFGLTVSVGHVKDEVVPELAQYESGVVRKVGNTAITITLRTQHIVGSGGVMTVRDGEKVATDNTSKIYGPGRVTVPVTIADHLLHQDQLAQQADQRLLGNEVRCFLITQKRSLDGLSGIVGVQVDPSVFGEFGLNSRETMVI